MNGTVRAVLTSKAKKKYFMHETIKFYVTLRLTLSEKLALKTPNVLIKNGVYRWFRAIFKTIDGLLRYGTLGYARVRYGTVR
jgi:hypothetical protein